MERWIQTKIEDFDSRSIEEHNREAMKREYYKHLSMMEQIFAKIIEDLEKRC